MPRPLSITIGTFDGVHVGHQRIFSEMKAINTFTAVFTFTNHPLEVLKTYSIPFITRWEQKVRLLENYGIDLCVLQPFSQDMAGMSYKLFLEEIYNALPFEHLFMGEDDAFGHKREGTTDVVTEYAKLLKVKVHVIPKLKIDKEIVSSSRVRKALSTADFSLFKKLTGRDFEMLIETNRPIIDNNLLSPGEYQILSDGKPLKCHIHKTGQMEFSDHLPNIDLAPITFIKKGS